MRRSILILLALFLSISLIGCKSDSIKEIDSISVDTNTLKEAYESGNFSIEEIEIFVYYLHGSFEKIGLTEDMISASDLEKLNDLGDHTITITYNGKETTLTIRLTKSLFINNNLTMALWRIFNIGQEIGVLPETAVYDEWLEEVTGTSTIPDALGQKIVLRTTKDYIQWQYPEDSSWTNLLNLTNLTGNEDHTGLSAYDTYLLYNPSYTGSLSEWVQTLVNGDLTINVPDQVLANYLDGVDLSQLSGENKAIIYAALERYLLENVYGGVPLYTKGNKIIYSERTQLFSPEYNGVLGFGDKFSQFTEDDSNVLMHGNTYGNVGEYTWRASFNTDPTSLNPWNADDSNTEIFTDLFSGALFDFYFDSSKTGFEILPSLAKSEPIPINPVIINGKVYAKVWQIELKDDLHWAFHPDTDTSVLPSGYADLDASDYLWTWQYALDHDWFRAKSGGGDFVSQGIKNAYEYLEGTANWNQVGLRLADGKTNTIELEYTNQKSAFDVKYSFAGSVLTPINQELFEALGQDYGLTPADVASSGVYVFETWEPDETLTFSKNELHPDSEMYHYTGYQYRFIQGADNIFAEFIAGRLDSSAVPASETLNYADDPRVKNATDYTTWRLMINGFGTENARDAYIEAHPDVDISSTFVPEPILQYLPMRQALYYGFDRYYAAIDLVKTYIPAHTLLTSTYFIDIESGLSVRSTDAGQAIFEDFGGGTNGYDSDAALDLFKDAVAAGIADGFYTAGTAQAYTEIELVLTYASSGNLSVQTMVENIKEQYEALFVDDVHFVKVLITVNDVAFPDNYYDYMMVANTDLGLGGISMSFNLNHLDDYCDDNRSGFTLNWGIDTHSVNIPIIYKDVNGRTVNELWSYNALVSALYHKAFIKDGQTVDIWFGMDGSIDNYLKTFDEILETSRDGRSLAEIILGDTLENIALDEGFDDLNALIVQTESGKNYLMIVSFQNNLYRMYRQTQLYETADEAILGHSGYDLISPAVLLITDIEIAANAYINGEDFSTRAEIAEYTDAPLEYAEIYATNWDGWSDAYVLLHIDDYYIGWYWL
ncbi:MAG: hypothetical protein K9L02_00190 [Acholeplasmataceae bacterium]|nr:hypothetical protein [Acholeplasmataceae bacterium]